MPDAAADLHSACSDLFPQSGIEEIQSLGPDPIPLRACARARSAESGAPRDADGRFAKGHSGNPKGRPGGIRNPRRRPLGLLLQQARPGSLAPLVRRKRYLRLPVLRLVLPPPVRQPDPGERLGIDFSRMVSAPEIAAAMAQVLAAVGRGEIASSEALRLMRQSRKPLRAIRRRLWLDLARLEAMRRGKLSLRRPKGTAPPPPGGGGGAQRAPEGAEIAVPSRQGPRHRAAHGPPPPLRGRGTKALRLRAPRRGGEFSVESPKFPVVREFRPRPRLPPR